MNCILPAFLMARILKSKGHRRTERFYVRVRFRFKVRFRFSFRVRFRVRHSYDIYIYDCLSEGMSVEITRAIKWPNEVRTACSLEHMIARPRWYWNRLLDL